MTTPYTEWRLADVWEAIYTEPKLLVHNTHDMRLRHCPYYVPLADGRMMMTFQGDPHSGIEAATLWFADKNSGVYVASVDDYGPAWTTQAFVDVPLVNEVCFPYELDVRSDVWCIVNTKTDDVRLFHQAERFQQLTKMTSDIDQWINEHNKVISEYVDYIDESQCPNETLCDSCVRGDGAHLIEHIVRGEVDLYMLKTLTGWKGGKFEKVHREHMKHVLRRLILEPMMDFQVKFAAPQSINVWMRQIPWSCRSEYDIKKKPMGGSVWSSAPSG